ncbi:hypothetical protein GCM10010844_44270 [Deinococcus radiotolerans]|uniref:Uncharacterized protein n=2 Tax=Deinococcus radiotolerans TaxID=1309407 RepID=A0ABQ2FRS7_9DEIO|nr:hypothetical protein GCM10010844_44270 [Deinococcus radiotolerans]
MPNFQPDIDLLDLAERLHEAAGYFVGGFVCIERRHRPWRIMLLTGVDSATLTTKGGFTYDRDTGMPLFDAHDTVLHPLTQERLEPEDRTEAR